jgi:hypothetical protein
MPDPENTEPDAGEGGFGPGEKGDSIEEGRENAQRDQESGDDADD